VVYAWRITTDYAFPDDPDAEEQRINPGLTIVDADHRCILIRAQPHDVRRRWAFTRSQGDCTGKVAMTR